MLNIRKPKNALKFSKPASWWGSLWREGVPTGNGHVGVSVLGGAANDTVLINHSDLYWQGYVGVLQDVADKVALVRKKLDERKPQEAEQIFTNALIQKGFRPKTAYPLPLCDFKISSNIEKPIKEYARVLNMENGEVSVTYKEGATRFERSMFVSRANGVICYEITKHGPKNIDVSFSLEQHDKFNTRTPDAVSTLPTGVNTKYENRFMYYSARTDSGTEFGVVGVVKLYGGSPTVTESGISITGAERVTVLLKPFVEEQRERAWKDIKTELDGIKLTYDKLLKEHTTLHSKVFNSAELDLNADCRDEFADKLLDEAVYSGDVSLALLEKLWGFGRFLTITGSTAASRPLAPYGLWCGDYKAPNSHISAAGGLQSIYAHTLAGNLADHILSVFNYYESVLADLKKNASRLYGARGIFIPSVMAHGTGVLGSVEPGNIHFTGVAGWISNLFYDYYRFTDDKKFLKDKMLPFMKEAVSFYENFFKVQSDTSYESSPSFSPHTTPSNHISVASDTLHIAKNSSIDFSIARELLKNIIEGSEATGTNKSEILKWKDMLTRIPKLALTVEGTVREYLDGHYHDNFSSPSTAFFYPVYPGAEGFTSSAELKKALETTAKKKLLNARENLTSIGLMRYAAIMARLGEGESAIDLVAQGVRGMAMQNLIFAQTDWRGMGLGKVDSWATYTIEPNMGVTNVLQEMLVQSNSSTIYFLPALPSSLNDGSVSGLLTRTGVEIVSMQWNLRKGFVSCKVKSRKAVKINLQLPKGAKRFKPIAKEVFDAETGMVTGLELASGKTYALDIRF